MAEQIFEFRDSVRNTDEVIELLEEEAGESCRAIELADDYLVAVVNPCLGPDTDRILRLLIAAPEMLELLEAATSDDPPQDFRNRARAIVLAVRGESGQEPDGAEQLGSQAGHARD